MFKIVILTLGLVAVLGCSTTSKTTDSELWNSRMQAMAQNVYQLFPLVSDPVAFRSDDNKKKIETSLGALADAAHSLRLDAYTKHSLEVDPAVKLLASSFKSDLTAASEAFNKKDYGYARTITLEAIQLCIRCHGRKPNTENRKATLDPDVIKGLKPLYRADWLAASRNFDEAIMNYHQVLKEADPRSLEWEQAGRKALALCVQVKNDPQLSEETVNMMLSSPRAPRFLLARAKEWKEGIQNWKTDFRRIKLVGNDLEKAQLLMKYASDRSTGFDSEASTIAYLRAVSYLHEFISNHNDPKQLGQAYKLLGESYEKLHSPEEINLSKMFYRSCILVYPHSEIASSCYAGYEESVYMDSLQGQVPIPMAVLDYLSYLKALAEGS